MQSWTFLFNPKENDQIFQALIVDVGRHQKIGI